ncbi:hypothetical protein VTN77DRAFT_6364 [Rasamsonia byssochlamydoides]|uniref:uncharacterized protein n=1 Tax=Rasamsonia byssochlamydoides TaxID=89139 RepID=UPI003742F325
MVCQQLSGTIVFTYYAPQFFEEVGVKSSSTTSLFATGVYGIVKTVFSMIFLLWFMDRIGRRPSLIVGAGVMGAVMLINACLLATHPPQPDSDTVSSYSIAMIVMIYFYCIGYSWSWRTVPWTYIYPNRIREYSVAMAASTQWAFNYCISKVVPIAVQNIRWRTFLMFAIFNFAIVVFSILFIKETKGLSLEEMDALFGVVETSIDVERAHQNAAKAALDQRSVDEDEARSEHQEVAA